MAICGNTDLLVANSSGEIAFLSRGGGSVAERGGYCVLCLGSTYVINQVLQVDYVLAISVKLYT